jgi:hypothetical protein
LSGCRVATAAVAAALLAAAASAATLASPIGAGSEPAAPWRVVGLPQQSLPLTRFTVVELDGRRVLRVQADGSYGNLVHRLQGARAATLAWRWRVDRVPGGVDLRRKDGDDTALKVCALFDMPLARVPLLERQLLRLASSRAGQTLPTATLCYVWDNALPQGRLLPNAYSKRVRYIVTHGQPGRWTDERHDLAADFLRAFGDESRDVPPLAAVAVGADTDNTGSRSVGFIDALRLTVAP